MGPPLPEENSSNEVPTHGSVLDRKNIGLAKNIHQLRQDVDVHRVIGMNVTALQEHGGSPTFWGYVQRNSHVCLALTACKIFEYQKGKYPLNSISGIIEAITDLKCSASQQKAIEAFAATHGFSGTWHTAHSHLQQTFRLFIEKHGVALEKLKTFRDKYAAHSEHGFELESLPSHNDYESFLSFSESFYKLISDDLLDVGPAPIDRQTGFGLVAVLKKLGVKDPKWNF